MSSQTSVQSSLSGQSAEQNASMPVEATRMVELMGVRLSAVREAQAVQALAQAIREGRGQHVVTANLDILRQTHGNPWLQGILARADWVLADGMPLVWAGRVAGTPLPERVAGSSLVDTLTAAVAGDAARVLLLGGEPGVADEAAEVMQARYPGVVIAGTHCPPMGFEKDPQAIAAMRDAIRSAEPDLIYVALGCPKQEWVIEQCREEAADACWIGIGISLSFMTGRVRRAPKWMQKTGLEWVHRLVQEPGRLAKRYLVQGLPFMARLTCWAVLTRFRLIGRKSLV